MPRRQVPAQTVRTLIAAARGEAVRAEAVHLARPRPATRLAWFVAQQRLLQVCLMADTGLRRGELAGLRSDDLLGRVLWLERAVKNADPSGVEPGWDRVGPTKTHRHGRLTVSGSTALCWREHVITWHGRSALWGSPAVWLFTATPEATEPVHPQTLASRFARIQAATRPTVTASGRARQATTSGERGAPAGAGSPAVSATVHGVRHTVATSLVALGQTRAAQHRLRHSALDTTLRHYVDHTGLGAGPEDRAAIEEFGRFYLPGHPFG
jgi:integrase